MRANMAIIIVGALGIGLGVTACGSSGPTANAPVHPAASSPASQASPTNGGDGNQGQASQGAGSSGGVHAQGGGGGAGPAYSTTYTACIRAHGLPGFPDPDSSGQLRFPPGMDPGTPSFQAAAGHCQQYAPGGTYGSSGKQGTVGHGAG
jgi:hypothetical protein